MDNPKIKCFQRLIASKSMNIKSTNKHYSTKICDTCLIMKTTTLATDAYHDIY